MTIARGLAAASLTLALVGAFNLANRTVSARAETRPEFKATLTLNGKSRTVTSDAVVLSGLLAQAGVTLQPGDEIHPALSCRTFDGMSININRLHTRMVAVKIPVPFKTIYKKTTRILPGRQTLAQHGVNGIKEEHLKITMLGPREVSRSVVKTGWDRKPENRLILVGTDAFLASRSLGGVRRCVDMLATEYDVYLGGSGNGITATGVRAHRGIVAVDPRVIPLGTHLYVPGYGYCVAADTGGAIKGRRIDLCVPSPHEADRYGAHRLRVYILK